jgi:hypothetical protein
MSVKPPHDPQLHPFPGEVLQFFLSSIGSDNAFLEELW